MEFLSNFKDCDKIVISLEEAPFEFIDAKSYLWLWRADSSLPVGNKYLEIKTYQNWTEKDLKVFKSFHKQSWGFFIPPREGDHMVVTGYLNSEPVAMAYLNLKNFNIDYGAHVVRSCWRQKIGTRILSKCFKIARQNGAKIVTCVRVLRSLKGTASDRRAASFYEKTGNPLKIAVARVKKEP